MLTPRESTVRDIGCGIGNAVAALRRSGHLTFGIDPPPEVLRVATELFDSAWFRRLSVTDLSPESMADHQLPTVFDAILMAGNVPVFLTETELMSAFAAASELLAPGGHLVVGTTTHRRGGPADHDRCAADTSLRLEHRHGDWHLGVFNSDSQWSVSVYTAPGARRTAEGLDGIHVLPPK